MIRRCFGVDNRVLRLDEKVRDQGLDDVPFIRTAIAAMKMTGYRQKLASSVEKFIQVKLLPQTMSGNDFSPNPEERFSKGQIHVGTILPWSVPLCLFLNAFHLVIAGITRGGKTRLAKLLVSGLLRLGVVVIVIEFIKNEWSGFAEGNGLLYVAPAKKACFNIFDNAYLGDRALDLIGSRWGLQPTATGVLHDVAQTVRRQSGANTVTPGAVLKEILERLGKERFGRTRQALETLEARVEGYIRTAGNCGQLTKGLDATCLCNESMVISLDGLHPWDQKLIYDLICMGSSAMKDATCDTSPMVILSEDAGELLSDRDDTIVSAQSMFRSTSLGLGVSTISIVHTSKISPEVLAHATDICLMSGLASGEDVRRFASHLRVEERKLQDFLPLIPGQGIYWSNTSDFGHAVHFKTLETDGMKTLTPDERSRLLDYSYVRLRDHLVFESHPDPKPNPVVSDTDTAVMHTLVVERGICKKIELCIKRQINSEALEQHLSALHKSRLVYVVEATFEIGRGKLSKFVILTKEGYKYLGLKPPVPGPLHQRLVEAVRHALQSDFTIRVEVTVGNKRVDVLAENASGRKLVVECETHCKESLILDVLPATESGCEVFIVMPNEAIRIEVETLLRKQGVSDKRVKLMTIGKFINGGWR